MCASSVIVYKCVCVCVFGLKCMKLVRLSRAYIISQYETICSVVFIIYTVMIYFGDLGHILERFLKSVFVLLKNDATIWKSKTLDMNVKGTKVDFLLNSINDLENM